MECAYLGTYLEVRGPVCPEPHRRFQTRASPGIARVKFWSIVLIAYHYIVLRDDGAESSDSKDNRQSKARRLGGGTGFFSTHKPTARAARVACPGNLAALKPPLLSHACRSSCNDNPQLKKSASITIM